MALEAPIPFEGRWRRLPKRDRLDADRRQHPTGHSARRKITARPHNRAGWVASSHGNKNLPVLLAGGGFKHGSHHAMPEEQHRWIPLANLFTTMLHKFGDVETDKFNKATGDIDEVLS
ncbi:MAG: hypothetical protein AB8G99_20515 [Planctomycetaceae bacterium]